MPINYLFSRLVGISLIIPSCFLIICLIIIYKENIIIINNDITLYNLIVVALFPFSLCFVYRFKPGIVIKRVYIKRNEIIVILFNLLDPDSI